VAGAPKVRLAELVASLSMGIDLGFGQPMEHVLRQCLIGLRLSDLLGLDAQDRAAAYYTALLVGVGCHSDAHEQAKWFGDDIALKSTKYRHEPFSAADTLTMVRLIGSGGSPVHRMRTAWDLAVHRRAEMSGMLAGHAALARTLGEELRLPQPVLGALAASYERWDGRGWPGVMAGPAIPVGSRVAQLAEFVEVANREGGVDAAVQLACRRRGTQFDPDLVDRFVADHAKVLGDLDDTEVWDQVVEADPDLVVWLDDTECVEALQAVARFVDLKCPARTGHSLAVAELATQAGRRLGLGDEDVRTLHRAGLVHDFGRLGVSNAIWDKPGPLSTGEWERVRLHPYLAERMLRRSPALTSAGRVVLQQGERLDGSGYPSGLTGPAISPLARVLAATISYQAMREPRPYREVKSDNDAASELRAEVRAGRLDGPAVEAVLAAAGQRVPRRKDAPAGLTGREMEVLRLLARGLSNKDIAQELVISPKTAGNHVEHIYGKLGVGNRAAASLWAMQQGLLPEDHFA
jgi:HD-GYP domain-containing protein (c-di-GMP phosphodiesterase class II)